MTQVIHERAVRRLDGLHRFQRATQLGTAARRHLMRLKLEHDEICLGVYLSEPPDFETTVALTTASFHVLRGDTWLVVPYESVAWFELPRGERQHGSFVLHLADGRAERVRLSVDPHHANDVHAFASFFSAEREEMERAAQANAHAA